MPLLGPLKVLQNLSPPFHPPFMDGRARDDWAGWLLALEVSEVEASAEAPREKKPGGKSASGTAVCCGTSALPFVSTRKLRSCYSAEISGCLLPHLACVDYGSDAVCDLHDSAQPSSPLWDLSSVGF